MMKMGKRAAGILAVVCLVAGVLPTASFADESRHGSVSGGSVSGNEPAFFDVGGV